MKTNIDFEAVRELELYARNTSALHYNHIVPAIENLRKKHAKGIYSKEKAVKMWEYVAEEAAKMYFREFQEYNGCCVWYNAFNKATRHEAAKALEQVYFDEYIA